ncbi:hypothetical protein RhiJN_20845 [Ceratobasidium sp. AG-Ba]|nr:hypothetical protein RhiJN_20845 [Ceratobasidium sp. AG-Ba]
MSSKLPQKRINEEMETVIPSKKGKHKRKPSEESPSTQFNTLVKKFANHLAHPAFLHAHIKELQQPLKQYQLWLQKRSAPVSPVLVDALREVVSIVGDYKGHMQQATSVSEEKNSNANTSTTQPSNTNPPIINTLTPIEPSSAEANSPEGSVGANTNLVWQKWAFYAREMFLPMVGFARLLCTVCKMNTHMMETTRMYSAISRLRSFREQLQEVNRAIKLSKQRQTSEMKTLHAKVNFLVASRRLVINRFVDQLTYEELHSIVNSYQEFLGEHKVYYLDELHKNHNCALCHNNATVIGPDPKPEYNIPPDGTPEIRGLFRKGAVSLADVEAHNFRFVTGGTTFGLARVPDSDVPELALFIDFPDYRKQTPEHCLRLERLAYLLHLAYKYSTPCYDNGPQNALNENQRGYMGVLGNRKQFFTKIPWGMYAIPDCFKGKHKGEWVNFQTEFMPELAGIISCLFLEATGAQVIAQGAVNFVVKFRLPAFGSTSTKESEWPESAGTSLTVSGDGFSNQCHVDNDKYRYVFSVYVFVDRDTGELITDPKKIEQCMKGGYLIWPDLHLALKIVHCSGVVMLFWRGTHERHCTILSECLDKKIARYGTSLQVNKRLFDSVQKYYGRLEEILAWELGDRSTPCPERPPQPHGLVDLCAMHN